MNKLLSTLITLNLFFGLGAQEDPKVGLALSGGGAKGMAHIGVLRVMEEAGVRPDYISGTSMGAIVGAMYAIGYTPDEIEAYLLNIDWDALLGNEFPRYRLSYLDRPTEDRYLVSFAVDSSGLALPSAANYGQYVLRELAYLMQRAHNEQDFTRFEIPFTAIATNLETGEGVEFDSGDIVDVLRATTAFPSMFSPHEINGELYVDGGVSNNLPISLLRERGMDIVIAVDAQNNLYVKEELNDIIRILEQISSFQNKAYYQEQRGHADLIIRPAIDGVSITSYEQSDSIIILGETAARLHMDQLRAWKNTDGPRELKKPALPIEKFHLTQLEIRGANNTSERFIQSKIGLKRGDSIEIRRLRSGMEKLYSSQFYRKVDHRFSPAADGGHLLVVTVDERLDNQLFRLGVHYDDDFRMGVLLNATVRNAILKNSKFSLDVVLSENPRGEISYIFERGFIPALGFRNVFHKFDSRVYRERTAVTEFTWIDFSTEVFLHSTLWDLYTIGGGVRLKNIDISEPILRLEVEQSNRSYLNYFAFLNFDSYDRIYKPKRGFQLQAEAKIVSEQIDLGTYAEPVSVVTFEYNQAISLTRNMGLNTRIFGGATIGPDPAFPYSLFLGGMGENYQEQMFPFIGYRFMELFGRNAAAVRADFWYSPISDHYFTVMANVGKLESTIDGLYDSDVLLDGYGISYGYDSPIGPLELFVMKSTNHSGVLSYVRLGYWF